GARSIADCPVTRTDLAGRATTGGTSSSSGPGDGGPYSTASGSGLGSSVLSASCSKVSIRVGENGGRGAGVGQSNRKLVAAPQIRPWQAPMPQRLWSLAWFQPVQSLR